MRIYFHDKLRDIKQIIVAHIFDANRYLSRGHSVVIFSKSFLTITADVSLEVSSLSITLVDSVHPKSAVENNLLFPTDLVSTISSCTLLWWKWKLQIFPHSRKLPFYIPLRKKRERISRGNFTRKFNLLRKEEFH